MQIFGKIAGRFGKEYDPLDPDRFIKKGKKNIAIILALIIPALIIALNSFLING